jgi:hypothetical protein
MYRPTLRARTSATGKVTIAPYQRQSE